MTRKGEKQQGWTAKELMYLRENAGRIPKREICLHLKRSTKSVTRMAEREGLSLRCYVRQLEWCPMCATYRSTISERTGECRVCEKKRFLEKSEERISTAVALLPIEERVIYISEETKRGTRKLPPRPLKDTSCPVSRYARAKAEERHLRDLEQWEIKCLDLQIDANKTRLKRIRQKLGINPRKKV